MISPKLPTCCCSFCLEFSNQNVKLYPQSKSPEPSVRSSKSDFDSDWRRTSTNPSKPSLILQRAPNSPESANRGDVPDSRQSNAFKLSDPPQSVKVSQSTGPRAAPFHRPSAPDLVLSKPAPANLYTTDANRAGPANAASRFQGAKDELVNRPPPSFNRDRNRDQGAGNPHFNSHYQHHSGHSHYQRNHYTGANHNNNNSNNNSSNNNNYNNNNHSNNGQSGPYHSSFHHQASLPNQGHHHPSLHHQPRSFPHTGANPNGPNLPNNGNHNASQAQHGYVGPFDRNPANGAPERSVKKWVPPSSIPAQEGYSSEERNNVVFRRVRGILNKITPDKFHKLSEELLTAGLDSPSILKGVIMLIFNKALEEPKYSSMYAQLCRKLSEGVPNFDSQSSPSSARSSEYPNTFCRFLLRKCEAEFSNRCNANDAFGEGPLNEEEEELRDIAKKKMLGNIKFICELGKQNLADEFILHRCIQQLCKKKVDLKNKAEDLECLCQIMKTVGRLLDTEKGKTLMDQYFMRMEKFANSNELPMRYRFMLQDVLDLRKNKWVPRIIQRDQNPKTINQIREEAGRDYSYTQPPANSTFASPMHGNAGPSAPVLRPAGQTSGYYGGTSQRALDDMHGASLPSFGNSMGAPINSSLMLDHDPLVPTFGAGIKAPFNQFAASGMYQKKHAVKDNLNSSANGSTQPREGQTNNPNNNVRESTGNRESENPPRFSRPDNQRPHDSNNLRENQPNRERGPDAKEGIVGVGAEPRFVPRNHQNNGDNRVGNKYNNNNNNNQNYQRGPGNMNQGGDRPFNMSNNNNSSVGPNNFNKGNNVPDNRVGNARELPPRFQRMQLHQQQGPNGPFVPNQSGPHPSQPNHPNPHHRNDFAGNQPNQRNYHSNQSSDSANPGYLRSNEPRIIRPHASNTNPQIPVSTNPNPSTAPNRPILPSLSAFNSLDSKEISLRPARNSILLKPSGKSDSKLENETEIKTTIKEIEKPAPVPVISAKELLAEQVAKIVDNLLSAANTDEGKGEAIKELQILLDNKNCKVELLRLLMEKAAERTDEQERERATEFILHLKEASFVVSEDFVSAYRSILSRLVALEPDVPKIKSIVAGYIARTVGAEIISLQEAFKLSDQKHLHPLFLLCLQQLHARHGEQWLSEHFQKSGIELMAALPECDRNKERLCEILKDRQLSFLQPLLRIESELQQLVNEDATKEVTPAILYRWIKDNVDVKLQQSSPFIIILFSALAKLIAERCDSQVEGEEPAQADKRLLQLYKLSMSKFGQILQSFLVERQDLQLSVLYALQTYCHSLSFPKGLVLRWFILLYELDIVDGEVFLKWKEEVNDDFPEKGKALFQVNVWLTWLEKAEQDEEDEEDEDEDEEDF